jgi:hypothetical protein
MSTKLRIAIAMALLSLGVLSTFAAATAISLSPAYAGGNDDGRQKPP